MNPGSEKLRGLEHFITDLIKYILPSIFSTNK